MSNHDDKETAFYAASVNAWLNTKMEYDKSLMVLSAAAIGILVSLLTTQAINSALILFVFGAALLSFIICLVSVLGIFSRNAKHIEKLMLDASIQNDDILSILDSISIFSFILGVILTSIIGLASAIDNYERKENIMVDKKSDTVNLQKVQESFNDLNTIAPNQAVKEVKSLNGIQKLAPQAQTNTQSQQTTNNQDSQSSSGEAKKP